MIDQFSPQACFRHELVSQTVIRIWEHFVRPAQRRNAWLILGSKWNLLVDTGSGMANLAEYVEPWLRRPLTAVATHTHVDAAGGIADFPDTAMLHEHLEESDRGHVLTRGSLTRSDINGPGRYSHQFAKNFGKDNCVFRPALIKRTLIEGALFNLGNRQFQVIPVPSGGAGSMALYEAARKELFCGALLEQLDAGGPLPHPSNHARAEALGTLAKLSVDTAYLSQGRPISGNLFRKRLLATSQGNLSQQSM